MGKPSLYHLRLVGGAELVWQVRVRNPFWMTRLILLDTDIDETADDNINYILNCVLHIHSYCTVYAS